MAVIGGWCAVKQNNVQHIKFSFWTYTYILNKMFIKEFIKTFWINVFFSIYTLLKKLGILNFRWNWWKKVILYHERWTFKKKHAIVICSSKTIFLNPKLTTVVGIALFTMKQSSSYHGMWPKDVHFFAFLWLFQCLFCNLLMTLWAQLQLPSENIWLLIDY